MLIYTAGWFDVCILCLSHFIFWQNLKMKVSHPRFLNIGNQKNLNSEFPACLERKTSSDPSCVGDSSSSLSQNVFLFPEVGDECFHFALSLAIYIALVIFRGNWSYGSQLSVIQDTLIQEGTPLLWPVWLWAAIPGDINLYITVYYEMADISNGMRFRTLRMHYNLQVCLFESERWNVLVWFAFLAF